MKHVLVNYENSNINAEESVGINHTWRAGKYKLCTTTRLNEKELIKGSVYIQPGSVYIQPCLESSEKRTLSAAVR